MKKAVAKVLPNPDAIREPIHPHCAGCERVFENHTLPEGTILVDVCMAYEKPDTKWRNYYTREGKKTIKGKEVMIVYHYNPCPLATHIDHSPMPEERGKLNPIKASKRK